MDVAVVGSGVAGTICALLLARRGHRVTLVDRDPGPAPGEPWIRAGVMQFHQPHSWRGPARSVLARHLPDVLAALEDAGAVSTNRPGMPDGAAMLLCRREVVERLLWEAVDRQPGIERVTGHAEGVTVEGGRASGVVVDGTVYAARLVVDAGGRVSKLSRDHRSEPLGGGCGMDYTSQLFELLPGAEEGPSNSPVGHLAFHRGYQPIVFIHDNRTFSVLLIRPSKDREISLLREPGPFAAAAAAIPGLADWVDPERSVPIGPVRTGGNLTNLYKCQPSLPGLVAIGDALATTSDAMAAWSERAIRPWWADHMAIDESLHRRWRGVPLDPDAPVATDLVGEAVPVLPELLEEVGPFFAMLALPTSLDGAREKVRGLIRQGWAPGYPDGPTREELVAVMRGSRSSAPTSCR